jgi:GrpB-like predicted nucleotidyltransferase (UPF0157 family)
MIVRDAKLQVDGKINPKLRSFHVCHAFDGSAYFQDWLNENPELREKYLDWFEAKANAGRQERREIDRVESSVARWQFS